MRSNIYICCLVCVFKRVNITRTATHVRVYFGVFSIYFYKRLCHLFWDLICHPSVRVGDRETERCMMTIEHAVNTRCVRTFAYTQCTRSTGHYGTVIFRWLLIYARRSLFLAILARIKSGCMYNAYFDYQHFQFSLFGVWWRSSMPEKCSQSFGQISSYFTLEFSPNREWQNSNLFVAPTIYRITNPFISVLSVWSLSHSRHSHT